MADDGNAARGAVGVAQRTLRLTPVARERVLRKASKRAFANRYLNSLEHPAPAEAALAPVSGAKALAQKGGQLLDLAKEAVTTNPSAKLTHVGIGAAATALLYQVFGDVLPKGIAAAAGAVGIALFWGRKAWRQFKAGWKELGSAVLLANELVTTRVEKVADAIKSFSKTAFIALTALYLPNLVDAGRKLVEVDPSSGPWAPFIQLYNVVENFFKAAPGTVYPLLTYILATAITSFIVPSTKGLLKSRNERKKLALKDEIDHIIAKETEPGTKPSALPVSDPEAPATAEPTEKPAAGTPSVAGK